MPAIRFGLVGSILSETKWCRQASNLTVREYFEQILVEPAFIARLMCVDFCHSFNRESIAKFWSVSSHS